MRHVAALPDDKVVGLKEGEYKWRDRAEVLVGRWQKILNKELGKDGAGAEGDVSMADGTNGAVPVTNGDANANGEDVKMD